MFPSYHTWLHPQPTPQRRPTPRPAPRARRAPPKRGQTTFGAHRQQFGALPPRAARRGDYYWQGDDNVYPFPSSVVHYEATTALQRLAAKARAV